MSVLAKPYESLDLGVQNGDIVASSYTLYRGVKKGFNRALVMFLLAFLTPFLLGFAGFLKYHRGKFRKKMKQDFSEFGTANEYSAFKNRLDKMDRLRPTLKEVANLKADKAPLVIKYVLKQMQLTCKTLLTFYDWASSRLAKYNTQPENNQSKVFRLKPESDLWNHRNKAYDYWI